MKINDLISILDYVGINKMKENIDVTKITICEERIIIYTNELAIQVPLLLAGDK